MINEQKELSSFSKKISSPKSRYLVFTSAGDRSNLNYWLEGKQNFDLWITYYGNEKERFKEISDYYLVRKGGKFPNLYYAYRNFNYILASYEAIFITDDDIIISGSAISRLFKIREQYNLWLLQPAFSPEGKISHPMTRVKPGNYLRFTNFVENTCPLFRKDILDDFMKVYDPVLVGWGIDWWFMNVLGAQAKGKVAVVDAITCINPRDEIKGEQREIDILQDTPTRIENWKKIQAQHNLYELPASEQCEYDVIKKPSLIREFAYFARALKLRLMTYVTKKSNVTGTEVRD
jgi:hypothetical protein